MACSWIGFLLFISTGLVPMHGSICALSLALSSLSPLLEIDPQCRFVCHVAAAAAAVLGSWAHSAFLPSR